MWFDTLLMGLIKLAIAVLAWLLVVAILLLIYKPVIELWKLL